MRDHIVFLCALVMVAVGAYEAGRFVEARNIDWLRAQSPEERVARVMDARLETMKYERDILLNEHAKYDQAVEHFGEQQRFQNRYLEKIMAACGGKP